MVGQALRAKPLFWEWRFRVRGEPFHRSPQPAIRDGNWKLLMNPDQHPAIVWQKNAARSGGTACRAQ
jgi:hypothetical protein